MTRGLACLLAGVLMLLGAGCSVHVQDHPVMVGPGRLRHPTASATPSGTRLVEVFLVRRDELVRVYRPAGPGQGVRAVLAALVAPLTHRELAGGYRSALAGDGGVPVTEVRAGIAYVRLPTRFNRLGVSEQVLAIGQITDTVTQLPSITGVQLVHDGHVVDIPVAGGQLRPGPVTPADYAPVTAEATTRPRSTTTPGSATTERSASGSRG